MTKMTTRPVLKYSLTRKPMILKLSMNHQGMELYEVYINHDLGLGQGQLGLPMHLNWKN